MLRHYVVLVATPRRGDGQLVVIKHVGVAQRIAVIVVQPNPKFGVAGTVEWFLAEPAFATDRSTDPSYNGMLRAAYKCDADLMRPMEDLGTLVSAPFVCMTGTGMYVV